MSNCAFLWTNGENLIWNECTVPDCTDSRFCKYSFSSKFLKPNCTAVFLRFRIQLRQCINGSIWPRDIRVLPYAHPSEWSSWLYALAFQGHSAIADLARNTGSSWCEFHVNSDADFRSDEVLRPMSRSASSKIASRRELREREWIIFRTYGASHPIFVQESDSVLPLTVLKFPLFSHEKIWLVLQSLNVH